MEQNTLSSCIACVKITQRIYSRFATQHTYVSIMGYKTVSVYPDATQLTALKLFAHQSLKDNISTRQNPNILCHWAFYIFNFKAPSSFCSTHLLISSHNCSSYSPPEQSTTSSTRHTVRFSCLLFLFTRYSLHHSATTYEGTQTAVHCKDVEVCIFAPEYQTSLFLNKRFCDPFISNAYQNYLPVKQEGSM